MEQQSGRGEIVQSDFHVEGYRLRSSGAGFNDVASSAWYADYVRYVVERGMFAGVGNGNFGPDANMTHTMILY